VTYITILEDYAMKYRFLTLIFLATLFLSVFGCATTPTVSRVSADTQTDLSGYWNDTDLRIVSESLINDCLSSPRIAQFQRQKGRLPVIIVGAFRNASDEHIDTSLITKKMETVLLNSGKAEFVASSSERGEIRDERTQQQTWASENTAKALANELGADFMLIGSVRTVVDRARNLSTRTYFVYAELVEVETNRKVWIGENSEIKKVIRRPSVRL